MTKIGITTTVPSEILLAAGIYPLDLNNLYINSANHEALLKRAESDGFPVNTCAWIKGLYAVALEQNLKKVICVTQGDCSNTQMLMEVLRLHQIEAVPFHFPSEPNLKAMQQSLQNLAQSLGTTLSAAEKVRRQLWPLRQELRQLDSMTYQSQQVSGWQNHFWQLCSSDFDGNTDIFRDKLQVFLQEAQTRIPKKYYKRVAVIGVPSIFAKEFYAYLESLGAQVVFNETQRQFAMPNKVDSLAEQYTLYTYPYGTYYKIADIKTQLKLRQADGVIHYVQAFCHRGISDIIYRRQLEKPVLTIEGNAETTLSQHLMTRIEAFLDILR